VVAYASRQLRTHERNYPTHDLVAWVEAGCGAICVCMSNLSEVES